MTKSPRVTIAGVERHATPRGPNTVCCDQPGCNAETYVEREWQWSDDTRARARTEAAAKGWVYRDGRDLCPYHAKEAP